MFLEKMMKTCSYKHLQQFSMVVTLPLGMVNRPPWEKAFTNVFIEEALSGCRTQPSGGLHATAAAFRTDPDIYFPDSPEEVSHSHSCKAAFKPLVTLEPENQNQVFCFHTIIQETVIAYFLKTGWKDVQEEAAYEFFVSQNDDPPGLTRLFRSCRKRDFGICDRKQSAVCDSDFMCIPAKVFDGIAETIKGLLDEGTPVLLVQLIPEMIPFAGIDQFSGRRRKGKLPVLV